MGSFASFSADAGELPEASAVLRRTCSWAGPWQASQAIPISPTWLRKPVSRMRRVFGSRLAVRLWRRPRAVAINAMIVPDRHHAARAGRVHERLFPGNPPLVFNQIDQRKSHQCAGVFSAFHPIGLIMMRARRHDDLPLDLGNAVPRKRCRRACLFEPLASYVRWRFIISSGSGISAQNCPSRVKTR